MLRIKESIKEYSDLISNLLWVISPENINRIINLIEIQTSFPIPDNIKNFYQIRLKEYYDYFNELLNITGLKRVR